MYLGGDLLFWIFFLRARVTLIINLAILLSRTTVTAIWARTAALFKPRILGLVRIPQSSLVVELVLLR